ncbi:MAG: NAD(+)/NADH kinase [Dehalococcoidia bacterium]|jgi:NAD+ kinase|nr:NAD(+)/NADH kinase [Dehalococcoidia bacterium]
MSQAHNVVVVYHGVIPEARVLASALSERFGNGNWRLLPAEPVSALETGVEGSDLVVTIGGDGTILRGAHAAAPHAIPVLGINMGRVGFMAELDASDALEDTGWYLDNWNVDGEGPRIENRAMIRATVIGSSEAPFHALNDVVVGRGASIRVVDLNTVVDGQHIVTYRGDGLVISTATGSTGYALALGGPVMNPTSTAFLLKPIAAHMSLQGGLLLRPAAVVSVTVENEAGGMLSVDGFVDRAIAVGTTVQVETSELNARFLRKHPPASFYGSLTRRLGMRMEAMTRDREEVRGNLNDESP